MIYCVESAAAIWDVCFSSADACRETCLLISSSSSAHSSKAVKPPWALDYADPARRGSLGCSVGKNDRRKIESFGSVVGLDNGSLVLHSGVV